jgi:hypothetical protein
MLPWAQPTRQLAMTFRLNFDSQQRFGGTLAASPWQATTPGSFGARLPPHESNQPTRSLPCAAYGRDARRLIFQGGNLELSRARPILRCRSGSAMSAQRLALSCVALKERSD